MPKTLFDPSMRWYLDDIRRTRPCSRKTEQRLFKLYRNGSNQARTALISANMRFVLKVALQYRNCTIPLPDLVSEGAMGLSKAIDRFDHTRGLKFISYAVWWIKAYMTRHINEEGATIRIPANQHVKLRKALSPHHKDEINEEIQKLLHIVQGGFSLNAPRGDKNGATYADMISDTNAKMPDEYAEQSQTRRFTRELLAEISERESRVLKGLFGIGQQKVQTLREVGESLNVSHERVRQLRDQALQKLRKSRFRHILKEKFSAQTCPTAKTLKN